MPTIIEEQNESKSSSAVYVTKLNTETGECWCTCNGWKFSKASPKDCTHTRTMRAAHANGNARPATPPPAKPVPTSLLKPMLASAMTKGQTLSAFQPGVWIGEVKYDGFRLMVRKTGATITDWTRSGKTTGLMPPGIRAAFAYLPDGVYDGELLIPGTTSHRATRTELVLFDVVELIGQDVHTRPYQERRQLLEMCLKHYEAQRDGGPVVLRASEIVLLDELDELFAGTEEGAILKRLDSAYTFGYRSPAWVKVKRSGAETVTIVGFERGDAESSTPYSVTLFRRANGMEGRCSTKDTATVRAIAANPNAFIGRRLVINFTELQPSGAFRHGGWDHLAGDGE